MNDEIDVLPKLLQEVKKEFELAYGESEIYQKMLLQRWKPKKQLTKQQMSLRLKLVDSF